MGDNKYKAYRLVIDIADEVQKLHYQRDLVRENYQLNTLKREKSGIKTASLNLEFVQMTMSWIDKLSLTAAMFVFRKLIPTVKQYNLLWHFPGTKSSERASIKELIDTNIIFRTETPGIFLINPLKIWRGTVFSAVACTKELLRTDKPNISMIRDLKPNSEYLLRTEREEFIKLAGDGIGSNLLEDSQADYSKAED